MAIRKAKITKAQNALKAAGMSDALTKSAWRLLDLDKPFDKQIAELLEDDPDLFEPAEDEQDEDDTPMSPAEARNARLRGSRVQEMQFRRPKTERPSTASATAREAAAHLTKNTGRNRPPVQKYREPLRDINAGHAAPPPRPASADALAARLRPRSS